MNIKCCGSTLGAQERRHPGQFVGSEVEVRFGGGDCLTGRLIAICGDYLVLKTHNKHIVYINARQVKSITQVRCSHRSVGKIHFIRAQSFHEVLRALRQQFVKIDLGRTEKLKGFISEVGPNQLLLVDNNELTQVAIHQIRAVSPVCQSGGHRSCGQREGAIRTPGTRTGGNRVGGEFTHPCRSRGNRTVGSETANTYSRKAAVSRARRLAKRRTTRR
ncbi:hypothetical protein PA598K_03146 [Paenibacillus sp. 598K]|uniref:hypothetical protein n=1 Tax=Paenibacillus sp. 598K TaxID=1117987 RepID=UPI000FF91E3B|nr:hypothetical protein [Paenibacillus sp. 598K]GBF74779.1 hypothetical protein PA598K_03146 [Paenibacillus sp. 598K]